MADWYVSSAAYAGYTAFQTSHAYTVGNLVVPTAPTAKNKWVFRCTSAGTSGTEPTWSTAAANNATVTSTGATFTNVTGQSTFFWTAAAGDMPTLLGAGGTFRFAAGDRMFVSSDHSETQATTTEYGSGSTATQSYSIGMVLSVNRAGSTPPVAADLTAGATATVGTGSISLDLDSQFPVYHYGMNYVYTGTLAAGIVFNAAATKGHYLDACQLYLNTSTSSVRIQSSAAVNAIFNNTTARFGATGQGFSSAFPFEITWLNTASAIAGATFPTVLFNVLSNSLMVVTARGVDFSAITGSLVGNSVTASIKNLFDSCKIASGVTRYSLTNPAGVTNTRDVVELVNCYDGSNFLSERYLPSGTLTTEFTITLSGGATDNVGTFSHKMVSGTNIDKYANTLDGFWIDVNNTLTGSSQTATVEIVSSASLNNDEISLLLQYQGTASSSVASFVSTLPATVLTTAGAVTTSTATWNSSPSTPVYQKLVATFTPQTAGRVRGLVRLGKASTTVYYQSPDNDHLETGTMTMLSLVTGHTYTLKLKWMNADGTTANPPATGGQLVFVGNQFQLSSVTLLDPSTVRIVTGTHAGVATVVAQSSDQMSVAIETFSVSVPPAAMPPTVSFDETTLTQTA